MLSLTGDAESPLALRSQLALTSAVPPELETLGALPTSSSMLKVPLGSAAARLLCLLGARLAALASSGSSGCLGCSS